MTTAKLVLDSLAFSADDYPIHRRALYSLTPPYRLVFTAAVTVTEKSYGNYKQPDAEQAFQNFWRYRVADERSNNRRGDGNHSQHSSYFPIDQPCTSVSYDARSKPKNFGYQRDADGDPGFEPKPNDQKWGEEGCPADSGTVGDRSDDYRNWEQVPIGEIHISTLFTKNWTPRTVASPWFRRRSGCWQPFVSRRAGCTPQRRVIFKECQRCQQQGYADNGADDRHREDDAHCEECQTRDETEPICFGYAIRE